VVRAKCIKTGLGTLFVLLIHTESLLCDDGYIIISNLFLLQSIILDQHNCIFRSWLEQGLLYPYIPGVPTSKKEIRWRWRWLFMMHTKDQYKHYTIGSTKKLTQARPMSCSVHMLLCTSGLYEPLINATSSFLCFLC
jgi:hypothetical protein